MGDDFKQPVRFNHLIDDSDKGKFKGSDISAAPGSAVRMRRSLLHL